MTYSDFKKVHKQLKTKPAIWKKFLKFSAPKPRSCGDNLRRCARCGRTGGHIGKYGLDYCRQCFREIAVALGFKKYS